MNIESYTSSVLTGSTTQNICVFGPNTEDRNILLLSLIREMANQKKIEEIWVYDVNFDHNEDMRSKTREFLTVNVPIHFWSNMDVLTRNYISFPKPILVLFNDSIYRNSAFEAVEAIFQKYKKGYVVLAMQYPRVLKHVNTVYSFREHNWNNIKQLAKFFEGTTYASHDNLSILFANFPRDDTRVQCLRFCSQTLRQFNIVSIEKNTTMTPPPSMDPNTNQSTEGQQLVMGFPE